MQSYLPAAFFLDAGFFLAERTALPDAFFTAFLATAFFLVDRLAADFAGLFAAALPLDAPLFCGELFFAEAFFLVDLVAVFAFVAFFVAILVS